MSMWLSKQMQRQDAPSQEIEETTVQTAVEQVSDNRAQQLQLAGPGGFAWRPRVGDSLLVIKDVAIGAARPCPVTLSPGECCLYSDNAYIHLTKDGRIEIQGQLLLNGTPIGT